MKSTIKYYSQSTEVDVTILEIINNNLPIAGIMTFVNDIEYTKIELDSIKDTYNIPPEISMFTIVHKIDYVLSLDDLENVDDLEIESYLIPSEYNGKIIYLLDLQP